MLELFKTVLTWAGYIFTIGSVLGMTYVPLSLVIEDQAKRKKAKERRQQ